MANRHAQRVQQIHHQLSVCRFTILTPSLATEPFHVRRAGARLVLRAVDQAGRALTHPRCAAPGQPVESGDPLRVQVVCRMTGELALFYLNADGSMMQLFPNSCTPLRTVAVGTLNLPGQLLPLPHPALGDKLSELHLKF